MTTKPIKAIPLVDKETTPMVEKVGEKENTPMVEMGEKKNIPLVQETNFDSLEINDLDTLFKIIESQPNAVMKWNKKTNNYSLIENTADTLGNTDSLEKDINQEEKVLPFQVKQFIKWRDWIESEMKISLIENTADTLDNTDSLEKDINQEEIKKVLPFQVKEIIKWIDSGMKISLIEKTGETLGNTKVIDTIQTFSSLTLNSAEEEIKKDQSVEERRKEGTKQRAEALATHLQAISRIEMKMKNRVILFKLDIKIRRKS